MEIIDQKQLSLCYVIELKYLCSYAGIMHGVDAICFTAGIGENSDLIKKKFAKVQNSWDPTRY